MSCNTSNNPMLTSFSLRSFDQTDWADQKQITTDRPRLNRDYFEP